tara:strand:+ start:13394 stop:14158 length:765 start_codon:yes stop_codon:yes gene_type:complete
MKICVLIKQVPSADSTLRIKSDGSWIQEEMVTFTMNESDLYALEEALQIKEKTGDGEVVAVSLGPYRIQRTIRDALARGADRAIHIQETTPYTTDPFVTASLLAKELADENFDLILSGLQSDDAGMGQTGVILGELLGMSTATLVMATELKDDSIRVKRELEAGWFQWVTLKLPALLSIQSGLNKPRYPSLKGIMASKKKEIKQVQKDDTIGALQPLNNIHVPQKAKRTEMLDGTADQIVEKLVQIMKTEIKIL